jgi:hypothetical protein
MTGGSESLLVGRGTRTHATWPNAPGSRLLQPKTHRMKFARSLSGLRRGSKGWGQVGEAKPTILRRPDETNRLLERMLSAA